MSIPQILFVGFQHKYLSISIYLLSLLWYNHDILETAPFQKPVSTVKTKGATVMTSTSIVDKVCTKPGSFAWSLPTKKLDILGPKNNILVYSYNSFSEIGDIFSLWPKLMPISTSPRRHDDVHEMLTADASFASHVQWNQLLRHQLGQVIECQPSLF